MNLLINNDQSKKIILPNNNDLNLQSKIPHPPMQQLQSYLLNLWTSYGVDQTYQNLFLIFIETFNQPKQQSKQIQTQIKKTYQKNQLYFLLQENLILRAQIKTQIQQQITKQTQSYSINKSHKVELILRQLCDKLKNLRRINLLISQNVLKIFEDFKVIRQSSLGSIGKKYIQIFMNIDVQNQFIKESFLNQFMLFQKGYDPFFLVHYQEMKKSQTPINLKRYQPVSQLFQMNISYVYRLMRAQQKMLKYMLLIDDHTGAQKQRKQLLNRQRLLKIANLSKPNTNQLRQSSSFLPIINKTRQRNGQTENLSIASTIKPFAPMTRKPYMLRNIEDFNDIERNQIGRKKMYSLRPIDAEEIQNSPIQNKSEYYTPTNNPKNHSLNVVKNSNNHSNIFKSSNLKNFQTEDEQYLINNRQRYVENNPFSVQESRYQSRNSASNSRSQKRWNIKKGLKDRRQYLRPNKTEQIQNGITEEEQEQNQNQFMYKIKRQQNQSQYLMYISLKKSKLADSQVQQLSKIPLKYNKKEKQSRKYKYKSHRQQKSLEKKINHKNHKQRQKSSSFRVRQQKKRSNSKSEQKKDLKNRKYKKEQKRHKRKISSSEQNDKHDVELLSSQQLQSDDSNQSHQNQNLSKSQNQYGSNDSSINPNAIISNTESDKQQSQSQGNRKNKNKKRRFTKNQDESLERDKIQKEGRIKQKSRKSQKFERQKQERNKYQKDEKIKQKKKRSNQNQNEDRKKQTKENRQAQYKKQQSSNDRNKANNQKNPSQQKRKKQNSKEIKKLQQKYQSNYNQQKQKFKPHEIENVKQKINKNNLALSNSSSMPNELKQKKQYNSQNQKQLKNKKNEKKSSEDQKKKNQNSVDINFDTKSAIQIPVSNIKDKKIQQTKPIKEIKDQQNHFKVVKPQKQHRINNNEEESVNSNISDSMLSVNKPLNTSHLITSSSKIKMIPGKITFGQFPEYLKTKKIHPAYNQKFLQNVKFVFTSAQNTQTYLNQFHHNDKLAAIALCSPTASGNIVIYLWVPIQGACDQKTSQFFFKKYIDYIQQQTTFKSMIYCGAEIPELKSQGFEFQKDKNYIRKRIKPISRQNFQFEYFFSMEVTNISFIQTTTDSLFFSDQITPFSQNNSWCNPNILNSKQDQLNQEFEQQWAIDQKIKSLTEVNSILQKDSYDTFQIGEQNIIFQNISLSRSMFCRVPKLGFIANQGFMIIMGKSLIFTDIKRKINKIELMSDVCLYFGDGFKNVNQMIQFLIKIKDKAKQQDSKFAFKMFSKQLYGRYLLKDQQLQKEKAFYCNWDLNFAWRDQIPGKIIHDLFSIKNKYGPQNFICVVQTKGQLTVGVEIIKQDFLY